ncbi:unnamed protein product [Rotaria magnacalcarata]|uniref:EGF-like domain-containing protein n=1 Tax=Rotaria magnacalcarata TaxID=392030 RepID=A0A815INS1_9BILA|nr:unnamed protein product [Rotaria magnacalcarata]
MRFLSSHLNEKQLCNGIQDRPVNYFEDEKLLCPWQNPSLATHSSHVYFTCHNGLQIGFNQVYNGILNCANGEDELLCRIADPPWNEAYNDRFLLDIDIYHPTTTRNSSDTCKPGWIGTECSYPDLICRPNPCFPGSMCISVRRKSVCTCPMNRFGPTCRIQTSHICHEKTCQNNDACPTLDVNARATLNQFEGACPAGFIGLKCDKETARFYIHFELKLIAKYRYIPLMIVRLIYIYQYIQPDDSYRRLLKNVQLENPLPIFHRNRKLHQFDFAFIPLYINANDIYGRYYLIASNNSRSSFQLATNRAMHINTTVIERNRCPYIDHFFNEQILNLVSLERAKFYQEPCHNYSALVCFHDDIFMYICDRFRVT